MPPIPVNPLAATLVRSSVPITAAAITTLRAEDALLVESCSARATRQEWRRYNKDGDLIAYVRHSPQLIYSVTATALDPLGENLANYHPGRNLSDRALAFLNGRAPFQFLTEYSGARVGRLIYGDPQQDPVPGDAMRSSFTIEHIFVDIDTGTYPAISGGGESGPYHAFSIYWEDFNGTKNRFLRVKSGAEPGLASLLASGLPPALAYSISANPGSTPIDPPGGETPAGSITNDITILGVYAHTSAQWLYEAEGLVPSANHSTDILIPYWYNAASAASATAIVAGGYWCGTTPPTTRPGTSHARAALWSTASGWISEPTPGVGPAWTRPTNPLASVPGLFWD